MKKVTQKSSWKILCLGLSLVALSACSSSQESSTDSEILTAATSSNSQEPNILVNVPPPQDADVLAETFFEKKEILEGFSEKLQDQIRTNLNESQSQLPQLGLDLAENSEASGGKVLAPFLTLFGNALPAMAESDCDPVSEFLCLDEPLPPEGASAVYTVEAGVDVKGRVHLPSLAVFGEQDPVIIVTVYNQNTGSAPVEVPILASDLQSSDNPEVAYFSTSAPLPDAGLFPVIISAYRVANEGDVNELFSKRVDVFRTPEEIKIEFMEARSVVSGVSSEATVYKMKQKGVSKSEIPV